MPSTNRQFARYGGWEEGWQTRAFDAALEALPGAAFLVMRDGVPRRMNRAGRAWLGANRAHAALLQSAVGSRKGPFRTVKVTLGPHDAMYLLIHDSSATLVPASTEDALTNRERDVLELLAHGATYDEAAAMLKIKTNTVRTHVRSIYAKLDASSKTEALRAAVRIGYIRLPSAGGPAGE